MFRLYCKSHIGEMILQTVFDAGSKEAVGAMATYTGNKITSYQKAKDIENISGLYLEGKSDIASFVWDEAMLEKIGQCRFAVDELLAGNSDCGRNVVLSGAPGGGKTVLSIDTALYLKKQAIKQKRKVKTYFFAGSYFNQFDDQKAIAILSDFLDSITKDMKKGIIVFIGIDEAESLLGKRDKMGHAKHDLVNIMLSRLSQLENLKRDKKIKGSYMLMCTTNLPHEFSEAMGRRMELHIECGIPSEHILFQIFQKKCAYYDQKYKSVLQNKKRVVLNPTVFPENFTRMLISNISNLMPGDLDNIVRNMFLDNRTLNKLKKKNKPIFINDIVKLALGEYKKKLIIVGKQSSEYSQSEIIKVEAIIRQWISNNNEEALSKYSEKLAFLRNIINKMGGFVPHLFTLIQVEEMDTEEEIINKLREFVVNKCTDLNVEEFDAAAGIVPSTTPIESSHVISNKESTDALPTNDTSENTNQESSESTNENISQS